MYQYLPEPAACYYGVVAGCGDVVDLLCCVALARASIALRRFPRETAQARNAKCFDVSAEVRSAHRFLSNNFPAPISFLFSLDFLTPIKYGCLLHVRVFVLQVLSLDFLTPLFLKYGCLLHVRLLVLQAHRDLHRGRWNVRGSVSREKTERKLEARCHAEQSDVM